MNFMFRHVNRHKYPKKHVLVCEDDIGNQVMFAQRMIQLFDPQGEVQVSFVPGGLAAAGVISQCKVDLVVLDHDMPEGNGVDLLGWMKNQGITIPVITASGIAENNDVLMIAGANHKFSKNDVFGGAADAVIREILGGVR